MSNTAQIPTARGVTQPLTRGDLSISTRLRVEGAFIKYFSQPHHKLFESLRGKISHETLKSLEEQCDTSIELQTLKDLHSLSQKIPNPTRKQSQTNLTIIQAAENLQEDVEMAYSIDLSDKSNQQSVLKENPIQNSADAPSPLDSSLSHASSFSAVIENASNHFLNHESTNNKNFKQDTPESTHSLDSTMDKQVSSNATNDHMEASIPSPSLRNASDNNQEHPMQNGKHHDSATEGAMDDPKHQAMNVTAPLLGSQYHGCKLEDSGISLNNFDVLDVSSAKLITGEENMTQKQPYDIGATIPRFFFPFGKPRDNERRHYADIITAVRPLFNANEDVLNADDFHSVTEKCGLPYFSNFCFMRKILELSNALPSGHPSTFKVTLGQFSKVWKLLSQNYHDQHSILFAIMKKEGHSLLDYQDFIKIMEGKPSL